MKKFTTIILVFLIAALFLIPSSSFGSDGSSSGGKKVSISFTNDIHSHLDDTGGTGGLAKMKTAIDAVEKDYDGTFLLDAGNFSMGTPFETVFSKDASEIRMLGNLGYDAAALGSSEFGYGAGALAGMLNRAADEKETKKTTVSKYDKTTYTTKTVTTFTKTMPELVCAGLDWNKSLAGKQKNQVKKLKKAWSNYDVQDYTVVTRNGIRMAVIGLMGDNASESTADAGVYWNNRTDRAKEIVKEIKNNGDADIIVCLSNGGVSNVNGKKGEDIELAREVPDIDLIISANGQKAIKTPITEGSTVIVSAAGNTENLGHIVLKKSGGSYKVKDYELIDIDKKVDSDQTASSEVSSFISAVNSGYMNKYGYSYNEYLADNKVKFTPIADLGKTRGEDTLGDLVSDSLIKAVKKAEKKKYRKVDVAVISRDSISGSLPKGEITAADAYNVCGLGMGRDDSSGYPLVTAYLTGKELKKVVEIDASLSPKSDSAKLYMSGISYSFNSHRLYLNRAFDIKLDRGGGNYEKIENGRLYRVVTGLGELESLSRLDDVAGGMLKVTPKDSSGRKITDSSRMILKKGRHEVKEWKAVADYIDSAKGNDIPAYYSTTHDRSVDRTGFSPVTLLKNPNNMGLIMWAVILLIIVLIAGLVIFLRQKHYDRRGFGRRFFKQKRRRASKPIFRQRNYKMKRRRRRF